ncbi:HEAT repeat domain-containing protein [Halogeometricum borinquense]|uniref:HEAT repeat domain-containing protein n=1 Tax=Halogeometricum borinquense TaxID=60847 RepID=A0A6C0UN46_9EURY|nr:HEAT repeat domain-containing protein [Halogeometricum borinquense]QIB74348.1 HEAT repeat domain-containing protein [Halogeometricum borinquense]
MRDEDEATDGPPDPQLHPENSPGFDADTSGLADIEVDRDVTIGDASLAELAASDTEPVESDAVADLLSSLSGDDVVERRRAALALSERERTEPIVQGLAHAATTDADADVRQFAVESLAKLGGPVAAETASVLVDDDDPWVRAEAVVSLDRLDRGAHADRIEGALDDAHHAARRNAAISLFKHRGEDALPELLELADDPSERVREWAAHLLGGIEDDRAHETLDRLAEEDERSVVRETAVRARDVDAGSFRRQFSGALDESDRTLPGEDDLNRTPDL